MLLKRLKLDANRTRQVLNCSQITFLHTNFSIYFCFNLENMTNIHRRSLYDFEEMSRIKIISNNEIVQSVENSVENNFFFSIFNRHNFF